MTPAQHSVADAMLLCPKTCSAATTVGQARAVLQNDHVHALLVVENGRLLTVVERADLTLAQANAPARHAGRLAGRTVSARADLETTWQWMRSQQCRRLAVVDDDRLLGLLCLKHSGRGFCTDAGVLERARERRQTGSSES